MGEGMTRERWLSLGLQEEALPVFEAGGLRTIEVAGNGVVGIPKHGASHHLLGTTLSGGRTGRQRHGAQRACPGGHLGASLRGRGRVRGQAAGSPAEGQATAVPPARRLAADARTANGAQAGAVPPRPPPGSGGRGPPRRRIPAHEGADGGRGPPVAGVRQPPAGVVQAGRLTAAGIIPCHQRTYPGGGSISRRRCYLPSVPTRVSFLPFRLFMSMGSHVAVNVKDIRKTRLDPCLQPIVEN